MKLVFTPHHLMARPTNHQGVVLKALLRAWQLQSLPTCQITQVTQCRLIVSASLRKVRSLEAKQTWETAQPV